MVREQKAENGRSKRGETTPSTAKSNGKRKVKTEVIPEQLPIVQSSTSIAHNNHERNGAKSESSEEQQQVEEVSGENDVVDDSVETHDAEKHTDALKKKKEKTKKDKINNNKKKMKEEIEEKETSLLYKIPMTRVSRIIKSEDPNVRITQEAVFIINKASEKFLQLFTTEAYAGAFLDRKKHIDYKHLSSVISKRRRLDFLSDFVPEKVKAEDAIKESPAVET